MYSIWICTEEPEYIGDAISEYSIQKRDIVGRIPDRKNSYDKLQVVLLCLFGNEDGEGHVLLRLLHTLLSDRLKPEEKQRILEEEYGIEADEDMREEMEAMCNLSEGIWERGLEQGMEHGRMEGEEKLRKAVVVNMLKNRVSNEDICMMVECDMAYLAEIKKNFVY